MQTGADNVAPLADNASFVPYIIALLVFLVVFFPLRAKEVELLTGIWWIRVLFLIAIALVATTSTDPSPSTIMISALLATLYVLAMNSYITRDLPLIEEPQTSKDHTAATTTDAPTPETQKASVRHRQYADLIQRCMHPRWKNSTECKQLQRVHHVVDKLHSRE